MFENTSSLTVDRKCIYSWMLFGKIGGHTIISIIDSVILKENQQNEMVQAVQDKKIEDFQPEKQEEVEKQPKSRSSPEPDLVAMTKGNQGEAPPEISLPPPVAPPRKKKKKKMEGLKKPDSLSIDSVSVSSVPVVSAFSLQ